jgi:hypothetical protein
MTGWESSDRARAQARARFWDATLAMLGRYAGMNEFEHERLDVYKAAIELLVLADAVAATLPRARGYLADQLRRAASSISFNLAEGGR